MAKAIDRYYYNTIIDISDKIIRNFIVLLNMTVTDMISFGFIDVGAIFRLSSYSHQQNIVINTTVTLLITSLLSLIQNHNLSKNHIM